ncbi:hypothetical protein [Pseudozobellia thermophila]|uniref:hypothetical protein n=1 Tax=Pseudozobellia thermophila TaxID=192903 RepID=UPI001481B1FA|nr:hypothetical protein [Pseudozobellia thermophila]
MSHFKKGGRREAVGAMVLLPKSFGKFFITSSFSLKFDDILTFISFYLKIAKIVAKKP